MHSYLADLSDSPVAFEILVGLPPHDFATLVEQIRPAADDERYHRLARESRRRAPGAGRRPALGLFDAATAAVLAARFEDRCEVALAYGVGAATLARACRALHPILASSPAAHLLAPLAAAERADRLLRTLPALPDRGWPLRRLAWRSGLVFGADGVVRRPEAGGGGHPVDD